MLCQVVDAVERIFQALGDNFIGHLFFVEGDNFLDAAHALAQVLAQRDDFVDDDGRARNGFENAVLPALDALGDFHLALAREQRHGAHLAQVHAHRIVGLLQRPGREVQINFFTGLKFFGLVKAGRRRFGAFNDIDTLGANGGQKIVEIFRRVHVMRDEIIGLIVGEIALLFSRIDQLLNIVKFIVQSQVVPFQLRPVFIDVCVLYGVG